MGRLTAHTAPDGTLRQFVQDAAGSHLQTQTRAVNESVGEWFREGQQRGVRYVFDRAGELRQRRDVRHNGEKEDFSWGDNRQLVAVRKGERLVRYGYDGLGRRVFKQTAEETRWFYWQGDALAGETVTITREPLAAQSIFDTGSRLQRQKAQAALFGSMREYVYYPGSFQPLALLTQEAGRKESWHYHCDPNGAPVRLTSLQGEIVWSEKTGVWGEKGEVYADRISNPLRFQGQYFDAETGLHYNRHRYYDPEIAGFISQDPIGLAGGLNVYQYAPNPLGWVDPWGLAKSCGGTTKFYRSMSHEDFEYLRTTGKLRGTSETFISPRRAFSENYEGVLVRFYLKNDALSELKSIGVKDSALLTSITYPDMPDVGKGWKETSAFFKAEGEQINIGLGKGKALDIFNQGIQRFERLN